MEWRGFKEQIRVVFVFIYELPFSSFLPTLLFLLALSNVARFLTHFAIFMSICEIALVNFALCQMKKMDPANDIVLRETKEIAAQAIVVRSELSDCGSSDDFPKDERVKSVMHRPEWAQRFQGLIRWALELVERQIMQDMDKQGFVEEMRLERCNSAEMTEEIFEGAVINFSQREMAATAMLSEEFARSHSSRSSKESDLVVDNRGNKISNATPQDADETDVPELEEFSSSGDEDVICKTVLESTCVISTNSKNHEAKEMGTSILEPNSKAADRPICLDNDTNSVDKHQILPPELGGKTLLGSNTDHRMQLSESLSSITKDVIDVAEKLEHLTDAGDFYTLEGDVLWHDIRKFEHGKGLDEFCPTSKQCKGSELQDHELSPDDYMIFPCRMQQSQVDTVVMSIPSITKNHHADSNALDKKVRSLLDSKETHGYSNDDINEDALIDEELRAIAFGRPKRGEDPAFVSSTTSFREFEECWPEFGTVCSSPTDLCIGKLHYGCNSCVKEPDISAKLSVATGCCDQPRACIAHSRSRSKILQSVPLLSSESLIREQEMDVLWQQYDEDSSRITTEGHSAVRQGGISIGEKISQDNLAAVSDLSPLKSRDLNSANASSCVDGCWQASYKGRRFPRRKSSLVGICRVLKELGLNQCIQSSKVKN